MKVLRIRLSIPEFVMLASAILTTLAGAARLYANDQPAFQCQGPTKAGCVAAGCAGPGGVCNSTTYLFSERSTFDYRVCTGAAGSCANWQQKYVTCENRFYAAGGCASTACTLTTSISACSP